MAELSDVELLSSLGTVLAPAPTRPDESTLARLHSTLLELDRDADPVDIGQAVARHGARPGSLGVRRRRATTRASILTAGAVAFALTAGVAAAAVATNTLPGPTRAIAYDLGLPVTSPGLFQAQQSLTQLKQAIATSKHQQATLWGHRLIHQMEALNSGDLSQIRVRADKLLAEIGLRVPKLPNNVTTPVIPTGTVPSVTVPKVTVPSVTVPSVTVPKVTVPSATVPKVTVPSVTVPKVTVPSVTVPQVTVPSVTVPKVTIPG